MSEFDWEMGEAQDRMMRQVDEDLRREREGEKMQSREATDQDTRRWAGLDDVELDWLRGQFLLEKWEGPLGDSLNAEFNRRRALAERGHKTLSMEDVEEWLVRMRDLCDRDHKSWTAVNWLVGDLQRRPSLDPEHDRED